MRVTIVPLGWCCTCHSSCSLVLCVDAQEMALLGRKKRIMAIASSKALASLRLKATRLIEPTRTCLMEMGSTCMIMGSQSGVFSSCLVMSSKQRSRGALIDMLRTILVTLFLPGGGVSWVSWLDRVSGPSWTIRGWTSCLPRFATTCSLYQHKTSVKSGVFAS